MALLIKNVYVNGEKIDIAIDGKRISAVGKDIKGQFDEIIEADGLTALPAFIDMHTHLREPGYEYKEDIASGSAAAVAGGFLRYAVCPIQNPLRTINI